MRRVLDRNGRLALSVWNNVGIYNTAEADFSDVEVSVSRINVHLPQIALSNGALGAMSAIGPKQTSASAAHMSASGSRADMTFCAAHVCF
jgi:hypothetical protein